MIVTQGNRIKIAELQDEDYTSHLEQQLTNDGFFAAVIKDPKPSDITTHPDFILATEWIRWLLPTPDTPEAWIAALGSSHDRYKLKKKLKSCHVQRSDIRVEFAPLNVNDYKIWYEQLFLPEIGEKPGAILFWPKPEALSRKLKIKPSGEVVNYFRFFMYNKDDRFIGGTLLFLSHRQSLLIITAAAFEKTARAQYELAIRGMAESLQLAISHKLKWLSYGVDQNFYGVDFSIGLQRFKASIGMKPIFPRYGSYQLIKILDRNLQQINSATGEMPAVLIFAIGGTSLSERMLHSAKLPPLTPKGNLDILWSEDFGLVPVRFVANPATPAVNVPTGMCLEDILLPES